MIKDFYIDSEWLTCVRYVWLRDRDPGDRAFAVLWLFCTHYDVDTVESPYWS